MSELFAAKGVFTTGADCDEQWIGGLGFRPVAVVAWWARQSSAGTTRGNRGGIGFWTENNSAAVAWSSTDGETVTRTARLADGDALVGLDGPEPEVGMRAVVESFDEDGVTLCYTTRPSRPWLVHYLALGGPGVEGSRVGWTSRESLPPSANSDSGFVLVAPVPSELGVVARDMSIGIGVECARRRAMAGYNCPDDAHPGRVTGAQRSGASLLELTDDGSGSTELCYLHVPGVHALVGTARSPSGVGVRRTRLGFRPEALLLFSWGLPRSPHRKNIGRLCLGGAARDTSGCIGWDDRNKDARETMTHVRSSTERALIVADTQSDELHAQADLVSIDDDGFTLDWRSDRRGRELVYVALSSRDTRGRVGHAFDRIARPVRAHGVS